MASVARTSHPFRTANMNLHRCSWLIKIALLWWGGAALYAGEIHRAILQEKMADVRRLLDEHPEWIAAVEEEAGHTPLQLAALRNSPPLIELLLGRKAEIEATDKDGKTALFTAAISGAKDALNCLIAHGAKVNMATKHGYTPLHYAAMHRSSLSVMVPLLQAGAEVNARTGISNHTPLHMAAGEEGGNEGAVEILLAHGADLNARLDSGLTPTMLAAMRRDPANLIALLKAKPDLDSQTNGPTALHLAVSVGRPKSVELLLAHGANMNLEDTDGQTPLGWCQRHPKEPHAAAMAEVLTKAGATFPGSLIRRTSIHTAAIEGDTERMKTLLRENPELIRARDKFLGSLPLHLAVVSGKRAAVELLLERGAEVNVGDQTGFTALHSAAQGGSVDAAELLIEKGAKVNARDAEERTPLHVAAFNGSERLIKLLIEHGADVNARSKSGLSPLDLATSMNQRAAANLLRGKGAQ